MSSSSPLKDTATTPGSVAPTAAHELPWWKGATIYQIYPRSFYDSNGDGIGDLPGIIEKLPYVASLGVDAVWLSPFFTSPMDDFGYDVADYRDVDPMFGTLDDFDRLVSKAHGLGLKVIIDQVYSHTSDQHAWFQESRSSTDNPRANWYVWANPKPDGSPPSNWQSVFGGPAWAWDNTRRQYYLHNFLTSQPDLNLHEPAVQEAVLDVARFWLDRGVDGFRLDAINFAMHNPSLEDNPPRKVFIRPPTRPFDYQQHLNNQSHPGIVPFLERVGAVLAEYPGTFTVAEVGGDEALREMKLFTEGEKRLKSAYSFDYLYAPEISPKRIVTSASAWGPVRGQGWPSWAFSNHDAPRAVSRWASTNIDMAQQARLYGMLLMALRGNAFIYQGEELGLMQADVPFEDLQDPEAIANWPETLGRDGARTPMPWHTETVHGGFTDGPTRPWLPVDERHRALAVDSQEADPSSCLHFFRELIAYRKRRPALRSGDFDIVEQTDDVLVVQRSSESEKLICAFNFSDQPMAHSLVANGAVVELSNVGLSAGAPLPDVLPPQSGIFAGYAD